MVHSNPPLAVKVRVEYVAVPVILPPHAQLSVERTVQPVDETGKLVTQQRIKVLIAQVAAPKVILLHQSLHLFRLQVLCIEFGRTHPFKVQQNDARIESRVAMSYWSAVAAETAHVRIVGSAEQGAWIQCPVLVQRVSVDGSELWS